MTNRSQFLETSANTARCPSSRNLIVVRALTTVLLAISGLAQTAHAAPKDSWAERCIALAAQDFSNVLDAPTQVINTALHELEGDRPAYCQLDGYVTPHVQIELWLPLSKWNGKLLTGGCGGFCVSVSPGIEWCKSALKKGYACISTDQGHKATGADGKWAYNNLQAEVDYGYRATHVAVLAGKAIAERFYARAPKRSYFIGCSGGGRQGLIAAQRFPWDFDGIVAGAPGLDWSGALMNFLWESIVMAGQDGKSLFTPQDLQFVREAAIRQCDRNDGLADGLIEDPRTCPFQPSVLACRTDKSGQCLSSVQVQALQKLQTGPTSSTGQQLLPGGVMPGAQLDFGEFPYFSLVFDFSRDYFRYMGFVPDPGPAWQVSDFDFDRDPKRLGMMGALYDATNPDLRAFKAAGGKLILYHGWNDVNILPMGTVDYYQTVMKTMGGRAPTQEFARLFMIPGMGHCSGGEGAWVIDYLTYLEAWVEKNDAPARLLGMHLKDGHSFKGNFPLDPASISFTRPVFPYPLRARYGGVGDTTRAENFMPVEP
jgi:hypothetical protein